MENGPELFTRRFRTRSRTMARSSVDRSQTIQSASRFRHSDSSSRKSRGSTRSRKASDNLRRIASDAELSKSFKLRRRSNSASPATTLRQAASFRLAGSNIHGAVSSCFGNDEVIGRVAEYRRSLQSSNSPAALSSPLRFSGDQLSLGHGATPSKRRRSRSGAESCQLSTGKGVDDEDCVKDEAGAKLVAKPTRGRVDEQNVLKELICPICLDYYNLPVTMHCGHTFCRYCISHRSIAGTICPLCRKHLGETLSVNTVLQNLMFNLGIKRQHPTPISPPAQADAVRRGQQPVAPLLGELWWAEVFVKPYVSISLCLRILLEPIPLCTSQVFFDDVVSCTIDHFTRFDKWSNGKWMFGLSDCRAFCTLVEFLPDDLPGSATRLQSWVESYIPNRSFVCSPNELPRICFRVHADRMHRIDAQLIDTQQLGHRLPWDCGRHQRSLIRLPHSSVSSSHLMIVRMGSSDGNDGAVGGVTGNCDFPNLALGLADCGATIGTMLKVNGDYVLKENDIVHVGDRLELKVNFAPSFGSPYKGLRWDKAKKCVTDCRQSTKPLILNAANGAVLRNGEDGVREDGDGEGVVANHDLSILRGVQGEGDDMGATRGFDGYTPSENVIADEEVPLTSNGALKGELMGNDDLNFDGECELGHTFDADDGEPIDTHLYLSRIGGAQGTAEARDIWVDPRGIIIGRGPHATSSYRKVCVTASNGYVSREHCLLYFNGDAPRGKQWILRDISTYGTYLRLKPNCGPFPLMVGSTFKAGQCKVEVLAPSSGDATVAASRGLANHTPLQFPVHSSQADPRGPPPTRAGSGVRGRNSGVGERSE